MKILNQLVKLKLNVKLILKLKEEKMGENSWHWVRQRVLRNKKIRIIYKRKQLNLTGS